MQSGTTQASDENATTPADAPTPPSPNADPASRPSAGCAPTDQQILLAASASTANHALSGQSPPGNAAQTSHLKAGKTPQDPYAGIGAAPAQLVNNLLQAEVAIGNTPEAATVDTTQTVPNKADKNSDGINAPQALIDGLQQAANLTDAHSGQTPADRSAQANSAGVAAGASASDISQNPTQAADIRPLPPAAQPATAPAASTAAATDTGKLVSLIPTSTTSSTAETLSVSSSGNSSSKNSSARNATPADAVGDVPAAPPASLPATASANGSGISRTSPQTDSSSPSGKTAGQQSGNSVTGAVPIAGNNFAENGALQFVSLQTTPVDSSSATAPLSTGILPAPAAASTTIAVDTGNPAQPTNTNDATQSSPATGPQAPGYLLFGAAPPSLQLHVTNFSATQTVSPGSLTSLVLDQAAYAVQYSHADGQQMQLHLNPPELGALQVDVSMHDGVLSARIEAQTTTAQQILTDNITQLKDSLTQQGVSFDRIDVHLAGSNADSGGTGMPDKSFAQQQDGGIPWDQQFVQPESDDSARLAPVPMVRTARTPLTTLDIMI